MTRTNLQTLNQYKSEHCLTQSEYFFQLYHAENKLLSNVMMMSALY